MDAVRDLGRIEPWQQSLERSLARRSKSRHASPQRQERRQERHLAQSASVRRPAADRPRAKKRKGKRSRMLVMGAGGVFALALPLAVLPSAFAGRGGQPSAREAKAHAVSAPAHPTFADSGGAAPVSRWVRPWAVEAGPSRTCRPARRPSGYVNPLADARVRPERIDQGVDYAGSGTLATIGAAAVTYVATSGTGWPGSFIEYRLLDGTDAGCYVYYAEGVKPVAGLRVGEKVAAGQPVASIIPGWATGIELGWGAGISTMTYAAKTHQWSAKNDQDSTASAAGKSFSTLIGSLGGPSGNVEG